MTLHDDYVIEQVTYKEAMDLVVKHHYLHRKAPCTIAFGMREVKSGRLVGVVVYGKPASHSLCKGVAGPENSSYVGELTRLWIEDGTPKNSESFLIGGTLRKQPYEIVVSYAEIGAGHVGTVYQATNWLYTGMSDKHAEWRIDGKKQHSRHLCDEYGGVNKAKEALGERMVKAERPRKHRYVFINADRRRKKQLLKELRYPIKEYPKRTTEVME